MTVEFQGYRRLKQSTAEIRLMRIHGRGEVDDTIECSFETVSLRDANPFYALSYVWGADEVGGSVLIDGQEIHVRKNLWLFLRCLRDRFCDTGARGGEYSVGRTIRVWADFICIQQNNLEELSYQVSIMGEIYETADGVYAWLGESQSTRDDGMKCIEEIKALRVGGRPWAEISKGQADIDSRLCNVMSSPYWNRLWIKQEFLLGKDVWFFFGPDLSNWKDMEFAVTLREGKRSGPQTQRTFSWSSKMGAADQPRVSSADSRQTIVSLLKLRKLQRRKVHLPELITRFHNAGCTDGRDRMYALLSLTDAETRRQIAVDYKKPLLQVLLENYHHWSGEHVSWLATDRSGNENPHYPLHVFCSQMARLLTSEELGLLRCSEELRRKTTAKGVFITSVLVEIASVHIVAVADCARIRLLSSVQEMDMECRGFILRVDTRTPLSGMSKHMIYASSVPLAGDQVARLDLRVFFLRRRRNREEDGQNNEKHEFDLLATGMEIPSDSLTNEESRFLSTETLQHPCHWVRQQLSDASFEMVKTKSGASPGYGAGIQILCNAAAIVTLLLESKPYSSHTSGGPEIDATAGAQGTAGESESDVSELWSPYDFGVKHQILMACRACKAVRNSLPDELLKGQKCECKWTGQLGSPT